MPLATIEEAIDEIRRGRMVILMDDKDRENEGDQLHGNFRPRPDLSAAHRGAS